MTDPQAHLRKLWKRYWKEKAAQEVIWGELGSPYPQPSAPFPEELRGLICGAKTRAGTPCKRRDLHLSGRCRLHGGLSTGPKSTSSSAQS